MISKKYIKKLDFETIEDIYNYIVESEINGAISQCKELLRKLSNNQFKLFCDWFNNEQYESYSKKELKDFIKWRVEK